MEEKPDTTDAPVTSLPVSAAVPAASSGLDVHTISSTKTLNYRSVLQDILHSLPINNRRQNSRLACCAPAVKVNVLFL